MNEYIYLRASHSDNELAKQLTTKLEEAGHKVWFGQDAADEQQKRQREFAIERSDVFILGLTPGVVADAGVIQELALAKDADKAIYVAQLRPASLPAEWEQTLADRPAVDLSEDFDAGCTELVNLLAGPAAVAQEGEVAETGDFFGGEHLGRVPALPGEQIVWSETGLYWFKKWKTLVRVQVTQSDQRLIFFWDERDIWKWKPREANELEEAFPFGLSLDQITAVGEVQRPKSFLIFATGKPFVEIMAGGNQLHRFSLQTDFEAHIKALHDAVKKSAG